MALQLSSIDKEQADAAGNYDSKERLEEGLKIEWGRAGGRTEAGKKSPRRGGRSKCRRKEITDGAKSRR